MTSDDERDETQPPADDWPTTEVTGEPPVSGRDRLMRAVTGKPSRGQVIVAVLLFVLGFAAATQIRLTRTDNDFTGQRREDLVDLLDSLSSANDRARTQLDDLEETRDQPPVQLAAPRGCGRGRPEAARAVLGILSGTVAATGPGVTLTIDDPDGTVTAATLLDGVEELRDAGAEAIEINDSVRVVASTCVHRRGRSGHRRRRGHASRRTSSTPSVARTP